MKDVFFSVIIPTYNRAAYLSESIGSVIDQSFDNWELLVIDDGSADNTKEIVQSFKDERLKYLYKDHEERSIARNYGISRAKGEYICFLDSDDIYFENHLQSLYSRIEAEGFPVALFNTGMNISRESGDVERPIYEPEKYEHPVYFVWDKFLLINSVCVHTAILKENKFPEEFNVWEDTHLWIRVVAQFPFFQVREVTSQWNVHQQTSVVKSFEKIDSTHVKNYLCCITHLFREYEETLKPYLSKEDMNKYILQKVKLFLSLTFQDGHYISFLKLYFLSLRFMEVKKMSRFAGRLILRKIRKGDYNV